MDFAVPANHRMNETESEKRDKYLYLAKEQKLWNMKLRAIPIAVGALGTVPKNQMKRLRELEN